MQRREAEARDKKGLVWERAEQETGKEVHDSADPHVPEQPSPGSATPTPSANPMAGVGGSFC